MRVRVALLLLMLLLLLPGPLGPGRTARQGDLPLPAVLAGIWDRTRLPFPLPPLVRHPDVVAAIDRAVASAPDLIHVEVIGQSVMGRSISHVRVGRGPMRVLLWSQMHGDEPTATVALFDVLNYLQANRTLPHVARLLDALTLHVVPMLNPDGAQRPERRNAQGLDINRDALRLQTPEGRALKRLRDRLNPPIGFNMHNQNWGTSVGDTGRPAAMSLLAVAYDKRGSDNPGRVRARKVAAVIRDAVELLAPGMVGRYDDQFEMRAFGDNLTLWGTSVILIETGPYPGPDPDRALVRLNFVALLTALDALASGRADLADPSRYHTLPLNSSAFFHTLVRNATVVTGTGVPPFVGDVGLGASRVVHDVKGLRHVGLAGRIEDLGDLRVHGALETIEATGLTVAPLWDPRLEPGDTVRLPTRPRPKPVIAVGQPAALVLLRPASEGAFVVERVVTIQ